MAQNGHFGAITGSVGSELVEQCGIKVEQVRAHPGQCNGTVSLVKGGLWGAPIGPQKGPQMAQYCNFGAIRGCCGSGLAEQCGM